ncbi:MAG: chemotaxis protein CheX [Syntrophales bacterium]|jgi:chemotaxis protein CheX|nr:chemotaxis protein CheX [Syntrophales bacterium]MDY0043368.1 chemotaxis protein CheX [Syntrophales bacterium]
MDVQFINPFLEGTINVVKTMAFVEPKPGKPFLKNGDYAKGDISGIIGLAGSVRGSFALSFSESCILRLVSNMLGEEIECINADIKDAVGEITNMVSGAARQKLDLVGISLTAALPTVVTGSGHTIVHLLGGPSLVIPFETDYGPFVADVCIGKPQN